MTAESYVAEPMPSVLMRNARGLWLVLEAAELRGLPMPFTAAANNYQGHVALQFDSRDQLVTWAEVLEVDVEDESTADRDRFAASGSWLEVNLRLVAIGRRKIVEEA